MINFIKSTLNLKTILSCYISAIGYGVGYNLPTKYNLHPIICVVCCLALGLLFDFIANKILSTKFYEESKRNKITVALCIYVTYLIAWVIVKYYIEYDLDEDFLSNIVLIIIIQLVLLAINVLKKYIKSRMEINKMENKEKLKDEELDNISGGSEPEEFDWRTKGYQTPIKDQTNNDSGWSFEAVADQNGNYYKKDKKQ